MHKIFDSILTLIFRPIFGLVSFFGEVAAGRDEIKDSKMPPQSIPPISINVRKIDAKDTKAFGTILCDAYELTGNFTLNDIRDFILAREAEHPNHLLFATLDDFDQACYTFGHSCGSRLREDRIPELQKDVEDIRDVLTFELRRDNFLNLLKETSPDSIFGQRFWINGSEPFPSIRSTPTQDREAKSYVQIVPVTYAAEAIIAFPNGYFGGDYLPFENYHLFKSLDEKFELKAFGIGASYIGFHRSDVLTGTELEALIDFLAKLFGEINRTEFDASVRMELEGKSHFYFCYAER